MQRVGAAQRLQVTWQGVAGQRQLSTAQQYREGLALSQCSAGIGSSSSAVQYCRGITRAVLLKPGSSASSSSSSAVQNKQYRRGSTEEASGWAGRA